MWLTSGDIWLLPSRPVLVFVELVDVLLLFTPLCPLFSLNVEKWLKRSGNDSGVAGVF